jgi:hypothetical protein
MQLCGAATRLRCALTVVYDRNLPLSIDECHVNRSLAFELLPPVCAAIIGRAHPGGEQFQRLAILEAGLTRGAGAARPGARRMPGCSRG